jgi:cyclopropane fatty-acyl-phospholipid synthase-like methyltransferase
MDSLYTTLQEKLSLNQFPLSAKYDIKWVIENEMGPSSLWLMEFLLENIRLEKGMRILDLGCGRAMSSIFIAKEFDVQIIAADLWIKASENMERIKEAKMETKIFPINAEAHNLPFADKCFDVIVSVDSYQYYGTNDLYLDNVLKYLKPSGQIGIVVPSIKKEFSEGIPETLKPYWEQDMYCFHTIDWWKKLWSHNEIIDIEIADTMPNGYENWLLWDKTLKEYGVLNRSGDVELLEAGNGNFTFARIIGKRK